MSQNSSIEWTDATWNPVRGCTKVSAGCKNCYAELFAERFRGVVGHPFEFGFDLRIVANKLLEPLKWRQPKRIFVNSMSDLFHPKVPDKYIEACFEVMSQASWHTYQILTKRPDRMQKLFATRLKRFAKLGHIWMGVSVENVSHGVPRIQALRNTNCAVRFLSVEPLLEDLGKLNLRNIDWVIVGGESGPRARPMLRSWVTGIRKQCREQNVLFFFKQWGGVQKSKTGRLLDGRTYDEMPKLSPSNIQPSKELLSTSSQNGQLILAGITSGKI